jgi:hypothetical protein
MTSSGEGGEVGSLLAELVVASALLLVAVTVMGATVSGPIRAIERSGQSEEGFEGVDRTALAFVTAVRAARPTLDRPALVVGEPDRLVLGLAALDGGTERETDDERWTLELVDDTLVMTGPERASTLSGPASGSRDVDGAPRVILRGVDPARTAFRYRDADGHELVAVGGLSAQERARVVAIELLVTVRDASGRSPDVTALHRASLRIVGPLA